MALQTPKPIPDLVIGSRAVGEQFGRGRAVRVQRNGLCQRIGITFTNNNHQGLLAARKPSARRFKNTRRTGVALDGLGPVAGLEGLIAVGPFAIDFLDALQNGGCHSRGETGNGEVELGPAVDYFDGKEAPSGRPGCARGPDRSAGPLAN